MSIAHWFLDFYFNHYLEQLVHVYAIAGWLVSLIPRIYLDATTCYRYASLFGGLLFKQLFLHDTGTTTGNLLGNMISTFWSEHNKLARKPPYMTTASTFRSKRKYEGVKLIFCTNCTVVITQTGLINLLVKFPKNWELVPWKEIGVQ